MRKLKVTGFFLLLACLVFSLQTIVFSTTAQAAAVAAINCGGPAYTDVLYGTAYSADTDFSGGYTYSVSQTISGTADSTLYQTMRWGDFTYNIPNILNGTYSVTLKFAETYWNSAGKRVFDVSANGQTVITNLDVYAAAGGSNKAYDQTFNVTVSNGTLILAFTPIIDNAIVNALEVKGSPPSGSSVYGVFYSNGAIGVGQGFTVTQAGPCWDITFTSASLHHNVVWPACLVTPGYSSNIASTGGPTSSAYCAWTYADYGPNGQYAGSDDGYICCRDANGIVQPPPQGPLSISFTCQW